MAEKLYIPKMITVGFKDDASCYRDSIAWLKPHDVNDVITETSLASLQKWATMQGRKPVHKPNVQFENKPFSNRLFLNKTKVKRSTRFGDGTEYIRVYDEFLDSEFEITLPNLLHILSHATITHNELQGEYIYAFNKGGKIALIPTNSEDYKESIGYTENLSKKITKKEMRVGGIYKEKAKTMRDLLYMGRHTIFRYDTHSVVDILYNISTNGFMDVSDASKIVTMEVGENMNLYVDKISEMYEKYTIGKFDRVELLNPVTSVDMNMVRYVYAHLKNGVVKFNIQKDSLVVVDVFRIDKNGLSKLRWDDTVYYEYDGLDKLVTQDTLYLNNKIVKGRPTMKPNSVFPLDFLDDRLNDVFPKEGYKYLSRGHYRYGGLPFPKLDCIFTQIKVHNYDGK